MWWETGLGVAVRGHREAGRGTSRTVLEAARRGECYYVSHMQQEQEESKPPNQEQESFPSALFLQHHLLTKLKVMLASKEVYIVWLLTRRTMKGEFAAERQYYWHTSFPSLPLSLPSFSPSIYYLPRPNGPIPSYLLSLFFNHQKPLDLHTLPSLASLSIPYDSGHIPI